MKNRVMYDHPDYTLSQLSPYVRCVSTRVRDKIEELLSEAHLEFKIELEGGKYALPPLVIVTKRGLEKNKRPFPNHIMLPVMNENEEDKLRVSLTPNENNYFEFQGIPFRRQATYQYDPIHFPIIKINEIRDCKIRTTCFQYTFGIGRAWLNFQ